MKNRLSICFSDVGLAENSEDKKLLLQWQQQISTLPDISSHYISIDDTTDEISILKKFTSVQPNVIVFFTDLKNISNTSEIASLLNNNIHNCPTIVCGSALSENAMETVKRSHFDLGIKRMSPAPLIALLKLMLEKDLNVHPRDISNIGNLILKPR